MASISGGANRLLAALSDADRARLCVREVRLASGAVLIESGRPETYAYFPVTCTVAFVATTLEGSACAIGMVGAEGVVGVGAFLAGGALPARAVVLLAGTALRVSACELRIQFQQSGTLRRVLLGYTQALLAQISQTAVCQGLHTVEQRLARCFLMAADRLAPGGHLALTQEAVSELLGVRRESVSHAAAQLQASGSIRYRRGRVRIVERARLEEAACECYEVMRHTSDGPFVAASSLPASTPGENPSRWIPSRHCHVGRRTRHAATSDGRRRDP